MITPCHTTIYIGWGSHDYNSALILPPVLASLPIYLADNGRMKLVWRLYQSIIVHTLAGIL